MKSLMNYNYKLNYGYMFELNTHMFLHIVFNVLKLPNEFTLSDVEKLWNKHQFEISYWFPGYSSYGTKLIRDTFYKEVGKNILKIKYISVKKSCGSITDLKYIKNEI